MSSEQILDSSIRGPIYLACCSYAMQNEIRQVQNDSHKQRVLLELYQKYLFERMHVSKFKLFDTLLIFKKK